jgi:hypothetical protein
MGPRHHHHDHHHPQHHHGPLESITHVHGGAMVLDIGGSVGALHVALDDDWLGRELHVATASGDDAAPLVHTGVWRRHVGGEHVATALFPALEAGRYRVLAGDGMVVEVRGGEVTDVDLRSS